MRGLDGRPFQNECSNYGTMHRFTTPCCYQDIESSDNDLVACPSCGRKVECTVEFEPVAYCRLVRPEEEDLA